MFFRPILAYLLVVMSNRLQDHLLGAITIVLQLLAGLVEDIVELLLFFKQLNDAIANLVTEHRENLRAITDGQAQGDELQDADYEVGHQTKGEGTHTYRATSAIL
jgi:UPF0716 family protein affecting phage T7 exclusion